MTIEDFVEQPQDHRPFAYWVCKEPLVTPIGQFEIRLYEAPDPELVACASQLAGFVAENYGDVLEIVYDNYQRACEDKYWMRGCGVPTGLRYDRVVKHIRNRSITVGRVRGQGVEGTISLIPTWDTEHGIHLAVRDGKLAPQDW
jgi:hypothetical protein